jgi:hypothetical protein
MACGSVKHAVVLRANWIVVGADGIARAQPSALKSRVQDPSEPMRDFDEAAECALISS